MTENNFLTAADTAYEIILKKIIDGEFKFGDKLSRRKMAEVTGVSVIPVIEALKKLESQHIVDSKPQWGSFVTVPTLAKIKEIYQLRTAVECQAARLLAVTITKEQREELLERGKEIDSFTRTKENLYNAEKMHADFHERLTEFTGVSLLLENVHSVNLFNMMCRVLTSNPSQVSHVTLVEEIAKKDPDNAERAMRLHIDYSLSALVEGISK